MTTHVVLVRPWTDAHSGGGCCGGDTTRDGICLDRPDVEAHEHDAAERLVGQTFLRLREELPEVDVQVVSSGNTAYLLPTTFAAVRRRAGTVAGLRAAARATTAGSVLVDGERVGHLEDLGPDRVVEEVRRRASSVAS